MSGQLRLHSAVVEESGEEKSERCAPVRSIPQSLSIGAGGVELKIDVDIRTRIPRNLRESCGNSEVRSLELTPSAATRTSHVKIVLSLSRTSTFFSPNAFRLGYSKKRMQYVPQRTLMPSSSTASARTLLKLSLVMRIELMSRPSIFPDLTFTTVFQCLSQRQKPLSFPVLPCSCCVPSIPASLILFKIPSFCSVWIPCAWPLERRDREYPIRPEATLSALRSKTVNLRTGPRYGVQSLWSAITKVRPAIPAPAIAICLLDRK